MLLTKTQMHAADAYECSVVIQLVALHTGLVGAHSPCRRMPVLCPKERMCRLEDLLVEMQAAALAAAAQL